MKPEYLYNTDKKRDVSGMFNIAVSEGSIDGCSEYEINNGSAEIIAEKFTVISETEKEKDVYIRRDKIKNTSDETIYLNRYFCRFSIPSEDVMVYTQQSNWINESNGAWQKLVTTISAENYGIRTTAGAAPMLALWDNSCERGLCFQLVPNTAWKISASRRVLGGDENITVIEMGISDDGLNMAIEPGECIYLPEIIFYDFDNKIDMGCTKLHKYFNDNYPRKTLPVIYNTWFANFDDVDLDFCINQAKKAAELGCEYYVVDAGWFGNEGGWGYNIGDWRENLTGAFCGKLNVLADKVRELGMKFGLWIEAERSLGGTPAVNDHPEYFIEENGNYFLDYSNTDARKYIEDVVFGLIEKYGIEFIKFDFNADCGRDNKNAAFYYYHRGHKKFIEDIKKRYPDIYLENCASGGNRMDLFHETYMDGVWFSDNQNPYAGTKIIRNTLLRMPSSNIERWAAVKSVDGFPRVYSENGDSMRLVSVKAATWQDVTGVSMKYITSFCSGGAFGITCDLTRICGEDFRKLKEGIAEFKNIRDFYKTAVCRPLAATDRFTVLQYSDEEEKCVIIQMFEDYALQKSITVYPKLKYDRNYGEYTSEKLREDGIAIGKKHGNENSDLCEIIKLTAVN